jgi:hypothetical protein
LLSDLRFLVSRNQVVERYGLPIYDTAGVREVVRALDLADVPLPSIRTAIDEVVE